MASQVEGPAIQVCCWGGRLGSTSIAGCLCRVHGSRQGDCFCNLRIALNSTEFNSRFLDITCKPCQAVCTLGPSHSGCGRHIHMLLTADSGLLVMSSPPQLCWGCEQKQGLLQMFSCAWANSVFSEVRGELQQVRSAFRFEQCIAQAYQFRLTAKHAHQATRYLAALLASVSHTGNTLCRAVQSACAVLPTAESSRSGQALHRLVTAVSLQPRCGHHPKAACCVGRHGPQESGDPDRLQDNVLTAR